MGEKDHAEAMYFNDFIVKVREKIRRNFTFILTHYKNEKCLSKLSKFILKPRNV